MASGGVLTAVAGSVAVLVLVVVWRRRSVRRSRAGGVRVFSLAGRTVVGASVIVAGQWLALTHPDTTTVVRVAALGLPALVASWSLVRALTVTVLDDRRRDRR
ncbi:hypothetical protein GCM10022243_10010 [Saccharothrix violaceirubra]|uniref:Uncharacterized protein n=1 Tax=Saccharothrix violaceirubra TaxID=413306 RepID=A0A7W7T539_9PSEU|nr:hypothetical protein [Saccharothrix violaceirubra]MBB4966162.1 hypothetical protein [Saccharothrix violaceirubra]